MSIPMRTLLVRCPDWPVLAAELVDGVPGSGPVAVLHANRVVACSLAARREGVAEGLTRREAQSRCPQLVVVGHDPAREARAFEPVVAAIEQIASGVAVIRPGVAALAARGPVRYFGSEEQAAERIVEQIAQECEVEAQVGVADGSFAAGLAARAGQLVPPGKSAEFLAGYAVEALERPGLAGRLRRLGVRTLGEFAGLPAGDVLTRFGFDAALAHRLAAGGDERPLAVRQPPPELAVSEEYDEPLDRVDVAAFAARSLAGRLHDRLAGHGLACTRLVIEAVTAHGQELHRSWRHDGLLSPAAITDRVRWQLEGWLVTARLTAGIQRLGLRPEGVLSHAGLQPGLWGDTGAGRERAARALARVQGLLGPAGVVTAVLRGGRCPVDQVQWVPWGEERGEPPPQPPWPGRLPPPAPATVLPRPLPAAVYDASGRPVRVSARLAISAAPARLVITDPGPGGERAARSEAGGSGRGEVESFEITGWAGPWPVDESWWAPAEARRVGRFQVHLADGRAMLLTLSAGEWYVAASYD